MRTMIIGCLDGYDGVDAILPRVDCIQLWESPPSGPSLPLYRRLGLGHRIQGGNKASPNPNCRLLLAQHARLTGLQRLLNGYFFIGFMLVASSTWAPWWATPHMLTESTRQIIPTTLVLGWKPRSLRIGQQGCFCVVPFLELLLLSLWLALVLICRLMLFHWISCRFSQESLTRGLWWWSQLDLAMLWRIYALEENNKGLFAYIISS
jgi:hypothetical protein